MKIICLPYAGGSASVFTKWNKYISPRVEIVAPELAGRGFRCKENFYSSIEAAAEDVYNVVSEKCFDDKFAIFGHSMGCFIAYELYRRINRKPELKNNLVHIFMSGNYAPHLSNDEEHHTEHHKHGIEGIKKEIMRLGGTPAEVFENHAFVEYFFPIISSDYQITETYQMNEFVQFNCGCTVLNGTEDELSKSDLEAWEQYSPCGFSIMDFPGSHFFINEHVDMVVDYINSILKKTY
jgi:surfactin synthase thioesterase subunit